MVTGTMRREFIKGNKKARKKERKHALDQETDKENDKEKNVYRLKNINKFHFQPLIIVSVICRFH